ncbi:MAG TPA: PEP-CTERM sorting domain-containing protein [Isosphaeraceae bacterium]|nr:PEP-CTERM sorting domain-containing protein [Isosphaeraceae bacterium]
MLPTPCRARPPLLALAMALSPLLFADGAGADTLSTPQPLSYSTSGAIDTTNVSGTNAISFHSMGMTTVPGTNSIDLGQFQVTALPPGTTATYANTPFTITFLPQQGGAAGAPVVLNGVLNGVVDGSSSNVTVSFPPPAGTVQIQPFPGPPLKVDFGLGGMTDTLTVANSTFDLSPAAGGGVTSVLGQVGAASVPEPATVAIFLTAIAGAGLRRRRRPRG